MINNKFNLSRNRLQTLRTVLLTSIFWVFIDAFLILYLTDNCSRVIPCEPCKPEVLVKSPSEQVLPKHLQLSENKDKFKQHRGQSFAYSSKNERGKFLEKLRVWFKEDVEDTTNPPSWPGEQGRAVVIPAILKAESEKRFKENQFNIVASDLIALNRTVPDQRSEACKQREYPVDLPTTSIIIVYHNEGNSTLLRGLVSIVRKTPLKYLKEIILVDDCSVDREYLHKPLDEFVLTLPVPVKIFRNKERLGLMRSRLVGAAAAIGDTMTFLDAHIEATNGWLPPLLTEIKHNRFTIVSPIIDVIKDDTFAYLTGVSTEFGGFDRKMVFSWFPIPKRELERNGYDNSLPSRTPTMAGGLFTIDRNYFYELGAYDEGMDIWGAENLEMSFRAWMCGGNLLIVPCSHVGHVFRKQTPYSFPGGTNKVIYKNNRRLIDVWTDEYVTYFHKIIHELDTVDAGDISPRLELKANLKCNSFKWYLNNIYPEAPVPHDFYHVGAIRNVGLNFCIDSMGRKNNEDTGASYCHGQGGNQVFEYSKAHQLSTGNLCLDTSSSPGVIKLLHCVSGLRSQQWDYDNQQQFFRNRQTASCLAVNELNNNVLISLNCDSNNQLQKWELRDNLFPNNQ